MMLSIIAALNFAVSPLFPSGIDELVFVLVYFLWFYFEIINQVFVAIKNRKSTIKAKNDRLSLLVIYLGVIAVMWAVGTLGEMRVYGGFARLPVWTFYLGIAVMIAGEFMRDISIFNLGRFFTFPIVILEDHKLITKGPYKYVRHPGYLGGILTFAGVGLVVQSWAAPIAAIIIMSIVYSYRIHVEEKALRAEFGKQYENYAKRTAMLIPNVL